MFFILKKLCPRHFYKAQNEENKTLLFRDTHISGKNKQKQGSDHHRNQSRCYSVGDWEGPPGGVSRGLTVFS